MYKGDEYAIAYIKENYKKIKNNQIMKHVGCSVEQFYQIVDEHIVDKPKKGRPKASEVQSDEVNDNVVKTTEKRNKHHKSSDDYVGDKEAKEFLQEHYYSMKTKDILDKIHCSNALLTRLLADLNMKSKKEIERETKAKVLKYFILHIAHRSMSEIASELKMSEKDIKGYLYRSDLCVRDFQNAKILEFIINAGENITLAMIQKEVKGYKKRMEQLKEQIQRKKTISSRTVLSSNHSFIENNYSTMTYREMGEILEVNAKAIQSYCREKGWEKGGVSTAKLNKKKKFITDNIHTVSLNKLAEVVGVSRTSLASYCDEMGITRPTARGRKLGKTG